MENGLLLIGRASDRQLDVEGPKSSVLSLATTLQRTLGLCFLMVAFSIVSADAGWLLMLPPLVEDKTFERGVLADEEAPLHRWRHLLAYDSAAECEEVRAGFGDDFLKSAAQLTAPGNETGKRFLIASAFSRCVPSEAVYPPMVAP